MIVTSVNIFTCKSQSLIITFTEYNGITSQTLFGNSVKFAGDVDNDGYDDMLVGSSKYDSNRGCVYLFYGGAELENSSSLVFIGETAESNFGELTLCAPVSVAFTIKGT